MNEPIVAGGNPRLFTTGNLKPTDGFVPLRLLAKV